MKGLILAIFLLAASFAWVNPGQTKLLDAEYEYVACNAEFAHGYVEMKDHCALVHDVPVMDSSEYLSDIDDALADARTAIGEGNAVEYGAAMWTARTEMLALTLATVGDAFQNKSVAFFSCVDEGDDPLKEDLETCRASAFETGKEGAHEYLAAELEQGRVEAAELEAMGANTAGMDGVLEYGDALDADIDAAFDSHDTAEVTKLYQKNTRLVLLFRLEKMISVMDFAEPVIEAGNNGNKEELLEKIADLKGDTAELAEECAYSPDVGAGYALKNGECWSDAFALMARFNSLQALYWSGR
jgi:hypothetical protein